MLVTKNINTELWNVVYSLRNKQRSILGINGLKQWSHTSGGSRIWHYGGRELCQRGGDRKSLKVLKVKIKVIFSVFLAIFLSKLCLILIASEASEEKIEKN